MNETVNSRVSVKIWVRRDEFVAWYLYKVGSWCFRNRLRVIAGWVVLLIVGGVGAWTFSGDTNDKFELGSTESSRAFDLIQERTPNVSTDGAVARLVLEAPEGSTLTSDAGRKLVAEALAQTRTGHVASVADPFATGSVSKDGRVAYSVINYDRVAGELTSSDERAIDRAVNTLEAGGLRAVVGGDAFESSHPSVSAELVGVLIAFVILVITLGSLVAAGMPLITAVVGVAIGLLGVTTLTGFVDLSSTTPALASMLGLAVGIDYALFIMFRTYLR